MIREHLESLESFLMEGKARDILYTLQTIRGMKEYRSIADVFVNNKNQGTLKIHSPYDLLFCFNEGETKYAYGFFGNGFEKNTAKAEDVIDKLVCDWDKAKSKLPVKAITVDGGKKSNWMKWSIVNSEGKKIEMVCIMKLYAESLTDFETKVTVI